MERYERIKKVGEGSFGKVFKAKRKCDGAIVAYKVTEKKGRSPKELESLRRECEIQKDLQHPNIIQMLDSFETESEIVVVTEYVEKELYEIITKAGRLSEERAQVIACDLVSALHYLHSNRIVHRDMKPQNVLLDPDGVAKLCDFGFARIMSQGTHVLMSIKGTPLYMAPELHDERPYDHNVDLWSLGCIIYELVAGVPPFQTSSMKELESLVRRKEIKWPDHISSNCLSFLQGLLQKDPRHRLSWTELLEHPFVKGRILTVEKNVPRSLTLPLSASQSRAKQQQLQSLASRFTSQSKKILEKQLKKIHSLRRSEPSGSESSASVDVLLNNLSMRASLRSDLVAADHAICQVDCPIVEEEPYQQIDQVPAQEDCCVANANIIPENPPAMPPPVPACCMYGPSAWHMDNAYNFPLPPCCSLAMHQNNQMYEHYCFSPIPHQNNSASYSLDEFNNECKQTTSSRISSKMENQIGAEVNNISQRRKRLVNWKAYDIEEKFENGEWLGFLEQSIDEMMEGETAFVLQDRCTSLVFMTPLRNPGANCRVIEYVACLMSIPFVVASSNIIDEEELERIQRIYLDMKLVPNLVYAVKLLMSDKNCNTETDDSIAANGKWRSALGLSVGKLQALERIMLLLCRLVHAKPEFLTQFCDAIFVVPDGVRSFQQIFGLVKRKSRTVSDLLAIMSQVFRSQSSNDELVEAILLRDMSVDDLTDLLTKLLKHRQSKLRSRTCVFLLLLGIFSPKTLQHVWGKSLRNLLESLLEDRDKSVRDAAAEAVASMKELPYYDPGKDS
ncbi:serine/threonine-protein kinase fused [Nasonia vitripennis]|uniref:non-specific serine/threonine protein kinase n=1 Tax=Nasonia vitripennis TaxID=7425 RepID=A0A7M7IPH7_NASVI|nr:serine/threonine-protein kinase fused [Nasonia vitripennis]